MNHFLRITNTSAVFTLMMILWTVTAFSQTSTVTDSDGNIYNTVKIGNQRWLAEDLRTTSYADGRKIPYVTDDYSWSTLDSGGYTTQRQVNWVLNEWEFTGLLPADGIPVDSAMTYVPGLHGVAVDGDGKIWLQPFSTTEEIVIAGSDGIPVPTRALYIYNPDGTPASFSPLTTFEYADGDVDTIGHYYNTYNGEGGTPAWEGMSGRGLRTDDDGNIIVSTGGVIYRISKDGEGMNKFPYVGADGLLDSPTAAAVDGEGNVYIAPVVPNANSLIKLPKDFSPSSQPEVLLAATPGYSRTLEVSADGNTIYWTGYSNGALYVYSRENEFSSFDPETYDTYEGLASESITFQPGTGYLWVSAGSDFAPASNGYKNQTWYAFDQSDLNTPLESITWENDAMQNQNGVGMGRPRGLDFSEDGETAFVINFNETILSAQIFKRQKRDSSRSGSSSSSKTYHLYNWLTLIDPSGICPNGWTVPTREDWGALSEYLGGAEVAGGKMKSNGTQYWNTPNEGATNQSGFEALPNGGRNPNGGFEGVGDKANYWSLSEINSQLVFTWSIDHHSTALNQDITEKNTGFSVRCLKNINAFLSADSQEILLGDSTYITVKTSFVEPDERFSAYQFDLIIPSELKYIGFDTVGTLSNKGLFMTNTIDDTLKLAYAGIDSTYGDDTLVRLLFRGEGEGAHELRFINGYWNSIIVEEYKNPTLTVIKPKSLQPGDVNGDDKSVAHDAAIVLQYTVGKDPLPEIDPLPWEQRRIDAADVNLDGQVLAQDAALILQKVVGLITDFPKTDKSMSPTVMVEARDGLLHFSTEQAGLIGFNLSVPMGEEYTIGEPRIDVEGSLSAHHGDTESMRIGIASALEMKGTFLKVPLEWSSAEPAESILMDYYSNSERRQIEVSLKGLTTSTTQDGSELPVEYSLSQNHPNPFNPSTTITYSLPVAGEVRMEVFNAMGQRVGLLAQGIRAAGVHSVQFDATSLSSGAYVVRLITPGFSASRVMLLVK